MYVACHEAVSFSMWLQVRVCGTLQKNEGLADWPACHSAILCTDNTEVSVYIVSLEK
jgi:hypothetical protein